MTRITLTAIVLLLAGRALAAPAVPQAVLDAEARRVATFARAKDAVLAIFAAGGQGGGSGVVISADGYALSNFHVAKPSGAGMKCGMADGQVYDAVIVGLDPTGDVALLKLFGRENFPYAEIADSDQVRVGDWVFAMGNPFLLATDFQPTATYGIISGVHRYQYPAGTILEYTDCLQTDASINPGNSGGPLFDSQGRLIGINGRASFEKRGRVNVGAAYAISINQIKNFLGTLRSGRIVDHATLGARVAFDAEGRVVVSEILEGSDAYRRGLRYDDEIVSFGGRPVTTPNGFKNALGIYPAGWRVPLSYRRDGKRYDILVRLPGLHTAAELLETSEGRPKQQPMPIPKPGDKPEGEPSKKPGDKPAKKPAKPDPDPHGEPLPIPGRMVKRTPAAPLPAVVKEHYQAKRGYANYYYNKQNQERIWAAWNARAKLADQRGTWTLAGTLPQGSRFRFELADGTARMESPAGPAAWKAGEALAVPQASGGLLPALNFWRRLAVEGLARFGDVTYFGTAPLPGHEGPVDVLVGQHRGAECRFYFDPKQGDLLAIEMFAEEDADPCEIYFSDYHAVDGRQVPGRMEVRFGDELFSLFKLDTLSFAAGGKKP